MDRNAMLNQMLYRMEEVFWHELSDCAPWKTEYVGIDFIQSQDIKGANEDEVIRSCIARIKAAGLVEDIGYSIGGNGILLENNVARYFADAAALYSYEGTREINQLIVGRAVTGLGAFT